MITHVVLMKFSDRADAAVAKARLESLSAVVPTLRSLRVELDTVGAAGSYDLCLTTTHDDVAGLDGYATHPAHTSVLDWLRPRLVARAAIDYAT